MPCGQSQFTLDLGDGGAGLVAGEGGVEDVPFGAEAGGGGAAAFVGAGVPAEWNSAIRQMGNLRYGIAPLTTAHARVTVPA